MIEARQIRLGGPDFAYAWCCVHDDVHLARSRSPDGVVHILQFADSISAGTWRLCLPNRRSAMLSMVSSANSLTTVNVQTAQNVTIDYSVAGVGDRILGAIIDVTIQVSYAMVVLLGVLPFLGASVPVSMVLVYLPVLFYHLACEVFMDGQSFGKMVMKTKVVRLDGTAPSLGSYLMRWIIRLVEILPFSGVPAIVAVLVSNKGQRLGDMAAGTCVIKLRPVEIGETLFQSIDETYQLQFPEVERLTDQDVAMIKEVLRTYNRQGRSSRMMKLVKRTADVVRASMQITTQMPDVAFLRTVVKDYNSYAGNLE